MYQDLLIKGRYKGARYLNYIIFGPKILLNLKIEIFRLKSAQLTITQFLR